MENKLETIVLGGGCFWCTEAIFEQLRGVVSVKSGYAGGKAANPSYEDVSSGDTNHAQVIQIAFDPNQISLTDLLDVFFHTHDPTTLNRQGADVGSQYRSAIYTASQAQLEATKTYIDQLKKTHEFKDEITTEVRILDQFFEAEDYHQRYYDNNQTAPYCQFVISPKLQKLREKFKDKLRT